MQAMNARKDTMTGPLHDVRVLDLTTAFMAPRPISAALYARERTAEVLREAGYDNEEINALIQQSAARTATPPQPKESQA